ncbi:ABC transporter permease [Actinophytocola xanthii]|uniref:ABC transporter permease n=1 Tax=Actinophytocola xanthii TaxID=1912961 RepID=A0A1Q8C5L4_9PSEU|nr:ABC transporter permease [Actinophytocola xanthii]
MHHGKYTFVVSFLLVPVGIYGLFVVSPYLQAIYISLTDWTGLTGGQTFVGLANYARLLDDEQFLIALRNNGILVVVVPAVTVLLGLFLASMLNVGRRGRSGVEGVRGSAVYRVVYFFPMVLSVAIIGVLFKYVFAPTQAGGILNGLLRAVGLDGWAQPWLGDPDFAFWIVLLVMIWSFVGFYVVLFSAAMQSIPKEIYEAALLDGAGRFMTFRQVTLPLVWDTVQVGWVYLAIQAMDAFALVHIMLGIGGGPSRSGDVLGLALYRSAFNSYRFGYASAIGVVLLLLTLVVAAVFMRVARRERVELS